MKKGGRGDCLCKESGVWTVFLAWLLGTAWFCYLWSHLGEHNLCFLFRVAFLCLTGAGTLKLPHSKQFLHSEQSPHLEQFDAGEVGRQRAMV